MRCPKCQYVGFEPSPRCKNCGFDFSFDGDQLDGGPALTLVTEPEVEGPMADFDLQVFDDVPARRVQSGAKPFDLDELLANGPASGSAARAEEPVIAAVSAVARRRQSSAYSSSASASAVATPPPMEVEALFRPEPIAAPVPQERVAEPVPEVVELVVEPVVAPPASAPATTELPLFMQGVEKTERVDPVTPPVARASVPASVEAAVEVAEQAAVDAHEIDDRPLVHVPATPRAPLAVRRTTPDPARMRAKYGRAAARAKTDQLETSGDLLNDAMATDHHMESRVVPPAERLSSEPTPTSLPAEWIQGVGPAKRLTAAALDSALLIGLNAAIVWFTLSVCGLAPAQANLLPVAPLVVFFLLLDAGYLVLFTAACGQTLGKMVAGIRVVGTSTGAVINDRITVAQAVTRSLGSIVSMLPLGAGFWFGLVGDQRAIHDRIAHTRVVAV